MSIHKTSLTHTHSPQLSFSLSHPDKQTRKKQEVYWTQWECVHCVSSASTSLCVCFAHSRFLGCNVKFTCWSELTPRTLKDLNQYLHFHWHLMYIMNLLCVVLELCWFWLIAQNTANSSKTSLTLFHDTIKCVRITDRYITYLFFKCILSCKIY